MPTETHTPRGCYLMMPLAEKGEERGLPVGSRAEDAAQGSQQDFDTFDIAQAFQSESRRVWRTLRALGVAPSSVDDALQDVFLVVHRRLTDFEGRSQLSTWLYAITYRVALAYRRRAEKAKKQDEYNDELPSLVKTPHEQLQAAQAAQLVQAFCQSLDENKRDVFVLCLLEERSAVEVAEILGENLNTIYSRLRAVKLKFQQFLKGKGQAP